MTTSQPLSPPGLCPAHRPSLVKWLQAKAENAQWHAKAAQIEAGLYHNQAMDVRVRLLRSTAADDELLQLYHLEQGRDCCCACTEGLLHRAKAADRKAADIKDELQCFPNTLALPRRGYAPVSDNPAAASLMPGLPHNQPCGLASTKLLLDSLYGVFFSSLTNQPFYILTPSPLRWPVGMQSAPVSQLSCDSRHRNLGLTRALHSA